MQPNLPLNRFLLFCEILSLASILCSFGRALRTPAGALELPHCGLKLQVAMYFGLGFFSSLICFGIVLSVTRVEKQGSRSLTTEV